MRDQAQTMNWMCPIKSFQNWLFDQSEKKPATIEAQVTEETVKTIRVKYKNQTAWLQKSLLMLEQNEGNKVTIIIPHWLFIRKFTSLKPANRRRLGHILSALNEVILPRTRRSNERISRVCREASD